MRKVISNYLRDEVAGAWPSSTTVRKTLPDIHDSEKKILKDSLKEKKIAIFAVKICVKYFDLGTGFYERK